VLTLAGAAAAMAAAPGFEAVRAAHRPSEAELLDRRGELLHELRVEDRVRRLSWVALSEVSPALIRAVVQAEDRRFFEHAGVDWRAMGDAAVDTLLRGAPRGASTLSMQLAAMLEPALRAEGARRSFPQKIAQIRAARELETAWTKRQILEAYLNLSGFRGELSGIGAAAHGLFHKAPSGLDARESALLAALLRGPNARPEVVARRACAVAGSGDCQPFEQLAARSLAAAPVLAPRAALAPHLARQPEGKPEALRVQTRPALRIEIQPVTRLDRRADDGVLQISCMRQQVGTVSRTKQPPSLHEPVP
jgi:penicillin-binding protein 1C